MTLDSCLNLIYSFWSSKPKRAKSYNSIFYAIIGEFDLRGADFTEKGTVTGQSWLFLE
jgi:hypothetical protein